jgi:hypothetical protein
VVVVLLTTTRNVSNGTVGGIVRVGRVVQACQLLGEKRVVDLQSDGHDRRVLENQRRRHGRVLRRRQRQVFCAVAELSAEPAYEGAIIVIQYDELQPATVTHSTRDLYTLRNS